VRLVGHAKDSAGRVGTAVELKVGSGNSRVVINPKTSQLMETRTALRTTAKSGADVIRTTYLSAGPSDNAPRPRTQPAKPTTPAASLSPRSKD
jgi:hypothetical protein